MPVPIVTIPVTLDTSAIPRQFSDAILKAQRAVKPLNVKISPLPLSQITGDVLELNKSLAAAGARVIAFTATTGALYGMARAFSSIVKETVNVEKRLTAINVLLGASQSSFKKLSDGLFQIAKQTALSFDEAAAAAEEFARQGLPLNETLKRTRDALILTSTSGIAAKDAVSALTAAVNTFRREALDTTTVINKLANVDADFAVAQKDLAAAISRAGAAAQDANVSFDELLGIVTSLQQTTSRGGSVIGNAIKTIFTRIQRPQVLEDLKSLGIEVESLPGKTAPALQILTNLAQKYYQLSDAQQSLISESVGGGFQINQLKALLSDLSRANSLVSQATKTSANSTNEAFIRQRELNKTISAQAAIAATNIKKAFSSIGELSVAPTLRSFLTTFNKLFDGLDQNVDSSSIGERIGTGILNGISSAIKGPGAVFAVAIFASLLKRVASFTLSAAKEIAGLNNSTKEQQLLQGSINNLLQTGNAYYIQRFREAAGVTEQEKIVLALLRAQNSEIAKRASAASALTSFMGARFAGSDSGRITRRADGYIPTANSGLLPAITDEQRAISSGVGGASGAKPVVIPNFAYGAGKQGTIVANSREHIVRNYAGGSGSAIFNPDMVRAIGGLNNLSKLGNVSKVASGGFIPNFAMNKLGSGLFGSVFQFVRNNRATNLGKKVFKDNLTGSPWAGLLDKTDLAKNVRDDYQSRSLLSLAKQLGALPAGIKAPRVFGSLARAQKRFSMGVEIAPGLTASDFSKQAGLDSVLGGNINTLIGGTGASVRKYLNNIGIFPKDLHQGNFVIDEKLQSTIRNIAGKGSSFHRLAGGRLTQSYANKLMARLLRSGKFGSASIIDAGRLQSQYSDRPSENQLIDLIQKSNGKFKAAAGGLLPAIRAEKLLTGETPKVGFDNRLPTGIGVFSPSQGSLSSAINQHLVSEPGRNLNNIGSTGAEAQKFVPNFASPADAAKRLNEISGQFDRFIEAQKKLAKQKERELLIAKTISDDELTSFEKRKLTLASVDDILGELGTTAKEVRRLKRDNPTAFAKSGLQGGVFDRASAETRRLVSEGRQERLVRDFSDNVINQVGPFGSASKATERFIKKNPSLNPAYASQIRDIGRSASISNQASRQQALFGLSFAAPILTDTAVSAFGNPNTQGGRLASGLGGAFGTALNVGTLLALTGRAKTGIAAGAVALAGRGSSALSSAVADPLDRFQKNNLDASGRIEEQSNAISSTINAYETLQEVIRSGGSKQSVDRASKLLDETFSQIRPGPERDAVARALQSGGDATDSLVTEQTNFSSANIPKQRNVQAVNRIAEITDSATASSSFLVNQFANNRRGLVQAFTQSNPNGIEQGLKTAFGLVSGLGGSANLRDVRGGFGNLGKTDLGAITEELIGVGSKLDFSKVNLGGFGERFKRGENSVGLLGDLFKEGGQDLESNQRLTQILLTTSFSDANEAFRQVITALEKNKNSRDITQKSREVVGQVNKFVNLSGDAINSVGFLFNARNQQSQQNVGLSIAQGRGQLGLSSLTSTARTNREFELNNLETRSSFINDVNEVVGGALSKIQSQLSESRDQIKIGPVANSIAGSLQRINQNPANAVDEITKIADALEGGSAKEETVKVLRDLSTDVKNQLFARNQSFTGSLQQNSLQRDFALQEARKSRQLGFLGGDFGSLINPDLSVFDRGFGALRAGNKPIIRNGRVDQVATRARDAQVFGDQAQLFTALESQNLLPESGPLRDKARQTVSKAVQATYGSTLDRLRSSAPNQELKDLFGGLFKDLPGIADTVSKELIPDSADSKTDAAIAQAQAQVQAEEARINAITNQTAVLEVNTKAIQELSQQISQVLAESKADKVSAVNQDVSAVARTITNKSRGFVPNFSAYSRELNDIRNGVGGARRGDIPVRANLRGVGPAIVNSGEYIIRDFLSSGKDAVFNRNMAKGFGGNLDALGQVEVPNFAARDVILGTNFHTSSRAEQIKLLLSRLYSRAKGAKFFDANNNTLGLYKYLTDNPAARVFNPEGSLDGSFGIKNLITPTNPTIAVDKLAETVGNKFLPRTIGGSAFSGSKNILKAAESAFGGTALVKPISGAGGEGIFHTGQIANFKGKRASNYLFQEIYNTVRGGRGAVGNPVGAREFRVHVVGTGAGKSQVLPGRIAPKAGGVGLPFVSPGIKRAIQQAAVNAVNPVAEAGALYGPDVVQLNSAFARKQNKALGFEKFTSARSFFGLGPRQFFGAVELNPSINKALSPFAVESGSGRLGDVGPALAYRDFINGRSGSRIGAGLGRVGGAIGRAGVNALSKIGEATYNLSGLAPSAVKKGSFSLQSGGGLSSGLLRTSGKIGLNIGLGVGAEVVKQSIQNSNIDQETKTLASLGLSRVTGEATPAGFLLSSAIRGGAAGSALSGSQDYYNAVRQVAEENKSRGVNNRGNYLFQLGEFYGGLAGKSIYGDEAGGERAGRETVAHLIASLGEGVGGALESIGGVKRVDDLVTNFTANRSVQDRSLPDVAAPSVVAKVASAPKKLGPTENFLRDLDGKLSTLTNANLSPEERKLAFASAASDLQRIQSAVKSNAGSSNPNLAIAQAYLAAYPEKQKQLENELLINRVLYDRSSLKSNYGFARGYVPNFAGYNRRSIFGSATRSAIRRNGGVVNRGLRSFGPLGTIKNIIDSGDLREAMAYISSNGLPSSFLNAGFNGFSNLGGLSKAIEREQDALVGRGIPRNLAKGFVFSGFHPEIGMGVGNILDEPAGMVNAAAGLAQGISRVKSQGQNPKTAGVPNYANNKSDELITAIQELIAALESSQPNSTSAPTGSTSSDVNVQHNINVNASINGQIETNNSQITNLVNEAIAELKVKIESLLTASRTGQKITPRPPSAPIISTTPNSV
jgi:TP901 family phage tail tape measure protein